RRSLCPAIFASTPCAIARGWHSRSLGRGWHRGRVVVDDFPVVAVLHIGEAVAGRNRFGFPVLGVGERVIATVDSGVPVDADQLVTELDGRLRQRLSEPARNLEYRYNSRRQFGVHRWNVCELKGGNDAITSLDRRCPAGVEPFGANRHRGSAG